MEGWSPRRRLFSAEWDSLRRRWQASTSREPSGIRSSALRRQYPVGRSLGDELAKADCRARPPHNQRMQRTIRGVVPPACSLAPTRVPSTKLLRRGSPLIRDPLCGMQVTLCHHLSDPAPTDGPFVIVLPMDYYDGLSSGVVRCGDCSCLYYLRAIALFGGPSHGSRVFVLSEMPRTSFDECHAVREEWDRLHAAGTVQYWRSTPELGRKLNALAKRRRSPVRVLCWDLHTDRLLAIRSVPRNRQFPRDITSGEASDRSWFQYLGLASHAA